MKTIFTFDLERGYQPNDINNYRKIIQRLASSYPWNYEIRQETVKNSHEDWIKLQDSIHYQGELFGDIFVYFEMPERVQNSFIHTKTPYLNFMTSKIRFQDLKIQSWLKVI